MSHNKEIKTRNACCKVYTAPFEMGLEWDKASTPLDMVGTMEDAYNLQLIVGYSNVLRLASGIYQRHSVTFSRGSAYSASGVTVRVDERDLL